MHLARNKADNLTFFKEIKASILTPIGRDDSEIAICLLVFRSLAPFSERKWP